MTTNAFIELLKSVNWDGEKLENGLTVGGWLDLSETNITSLPDGLTVGGSLDLRGTNITSLPDGLTVGGSLDLRGTNITSFPDGLTVGGWLDLRGTNITSLPDGLTVGGWLDLSGTKILMVERQNYKELNHGDKTSKWIYADGILTHIKTVKTVNDVTLYISPYSTVVVTKDHQIFAHGKDIRSAIRDLQFKTAKRDIEQYRNMGLDTPIVFDEAVIMYRVITGACSYGTQQFLDEHPELAKKKTITIKEMIDVTKQEYGSETFTSYFEDEK